VLTVTELLPQSKSASWQTRSFDIFPESSNEAQPLTLWEMPLEEAKASAATGRVPTIQLRWREGELELCALQNRRGSNEDDVITLVPEERILLSVPLDPARLAPFHKTHESAADEDAGDFEKTPGNGHEANGHRFMAFYGSEDDETGIEWHLWLRDLVRRSEWDRWKIVEAQQMSKVS
jgi:hypothetical protein